MNTNGNSIHLRPGDKIRLKDGREAIFFHGEHTNDMKSAILTTSVGKIRSSDLEGWTTSTAFSWKQTDVQIEKWLRRKKKEGDPDPMALDADANEFYALDEKGKLERIPYAVGLLRDALAEAERKQRYADDIRKFRSDLGLDCG